MASAHSLAKLTDGPARSGIRILPETLSNKIAAGEVVERPASVVKELVENSLDAGSSKIMIEIENGGRRLIRVADDGAGMGRDDALLSVERYATSKILSDADLFNIRTLGFRGEALPSIASVSRFTLETRNRGSEAGTRIHIEGGKITQVVDAGIPVGTMISVRDLFFNTPARRKFLKGVATEMGHIGDVVAGMALAWPQVRFDLLHHQKSVKLWLSVSDPRLRAADTLGIQRPAELIEVQAAEDDLELSGWIAVPGITRKTTQGVYLFVNQRHVKDRVIRHALIEGYAGRLMKGCFPLAVLYLQVPGDQVDVNVHPAKAEVRFMQQGKVHELVRAAVFRSLGQADKPAFQPNRLKASTAEIPQISEGSGNFQPNRDFCPNRNAQPLLSPSRGATAAGWSAPLTPAPPEKPPEPDQLPLFHQPTWDKIRIIGQLHDTYLVCETDAGLMLIDQHAAHERILYEKLKHRSPHAPIQSQLLIIPEIVELGFREAAVLEQLMPEFAETGLDMEHFGGNTFAVKAVPAFLTDTAIGPLVREIVAELVKLGLEGGAGVEPYRDQYHILMACHGAVRASQRLTHEQMIGLLKQLDQCQNPRQCPHGRPIAIDWPFAVLEKNFRRSL